MTKLVYFSNTFGMTFILKSNLSSSCVITLHKKMRFSIDYFFSQCGGFGHIYWRNPQWKTSFFCAV